MKINDIANLLVLERILVIQKPSGSGVYTKSIIPGKSDDQLVAAFLTALGSFISEMKPDTPTRGKPLLARKMEEIIGHRRFIIFLIEAEHVAVAAILKDEPLNSNLLEKRLRSLTKAIEEKFKNELINFQGNLAPFERIAELLDQYLFVSLMETPWRFKPTVDNNVTVTKEVQLVKSILWEIQSRLSEREGHYFDALTELCLKKTGVLGYLEVIESLITLIQSKELVPLNEDVKIPIFKLKDLEGLKRVQSPVIADSHEPALPDLMEPNEAMITSPTNLFDENEPITSKTSVSKIKSLESTFDKISTSQESGTNPQSPEHHSIPASTKTMEVSNKIITNQNETSLLQLLTDPATIEEISIEESIASPEITSESIEITTAERTLMVDVDINSILEQLRNLSPADLPPDLIVDILKRDITFERLGTSNLVFDEKEGSFDELKRDLQKLTMNAHVESMLDNPTNGKIVIIESPSNQSVFAVSVTKIQENMENGYLWIIAMKRNQ